MTLRNFNFIYCKKLLLIQWLKKCLQLFWMLESKLVVIYFMFVLLRPRRNDREQFQRKRRAFHWFSSNSEVEATWASLISWPHKTSNIIMKFTCFELEKIITTFSNHRYNRCPASNECAAIDLGSRSQTPKKGTFEK